MLNINKFQNEMILEIEVDKIIHTWSDDKGMGNFVNYLNLEFMGENRIYIHIDNKTDITIKDEIINFIKKKLQLWRRLTI